jgi:acyl-CoA reductase-like NAD-dependent aldehyde dehydrogenase
MDGINIPEAGTTAAYKMLIGDEWKAAHSDQVIESVNPAREDVIATVPHADEADIAEAVQTGKHPEIMRIAFTGSVPTGQAIMREAATGMKRLSLELGGKNPMIVFPDVDLEKATTGCIKGMNLARSMGQSCQSNSRVSVHEKIYDRFVEQLVAKVEKLKIGNPRDHKTTIGRVNSKRHFERIMGFIDSGKSEGAKLTIGGKRAFKKGFSSSLPYSRMFRCACASEKKRFLGRSSACSAGGISM